MSEERLERLERKLDALTAGVAKGFDRVEGQFERVDARFDRVDARFDQVEALFERVDSRFDRVEKYLKSIEKTQGTINGELSDSVASQEQRLAAIEKKI